MRYRDFVVNLISHWMIEAANITCGDYKHNESEFAMANLTPVPSKKVLYRCSHNTAISSSIGLYSQEWLHSMPVCVLSY